MRLPASLSSGALALALATPLAGAGCVTRTVYVIDDDRSDPPPRTAVATPAYDEPASGRTIEDEAGIRDASDFYEPLSPYGRWISYPGYGMVWQPSVAVVGASFRPYTHGHWERSEYGWTWIDHHPFGWATGHYGRWFYDGSYGWIWVPGTVWAPAWVSWRSGGGYVGWAPLPPGAVFGGSYTVYETSWVFVSTSSFGVSYVGSALVVGSAYHTCYAATYPTRDTYVVYGRRYYRGPAEDEIARGGGRVIHRPAREADRERPVTRPPRPPEGTTNSRPRNRDDDIDDGRGGRGGHDPGGRPRDRDDGGSHDGDDDAYDRPRGGDRDRGHGNDDDRDDEDNPGRGTGRGRDDGQRDDGKSRDPRGRDGARGWFDEPRPGTTDRDEAIPGRIDTRPDLTDRDAPAAGVIDTRPGEPIGNPRPIAPRPIDPRPDLDNGDRTGDRFPWGDDLPKKQYPEDPERFRSFQRPDLGSPAVQPQRPFPGERGVEPAPMPQRGPDFGRDLDRGPDRGPDRGIDRGIDRGSDRGLAPAPSYDRRPAPIDRAPDIRPYPSAPMPSPARGPSRSPHVDRSPSTQRAPATPSSPSVSAPAASGGGDAQPSGDAKKKSKKKAEAKKKGR